MLCTRREIKNYLGLKNVTSVENDLIEDLIVSVGQEIEGHCLKAIEVTISTVYFSGDGSSNIYPFTPIVSVSGIWDNTLLEFDDDHLVDTDDYVVFPDSIQMKSSYFTEGNNNIKLIYTHGYTTIPSDLKQVCIEEAGRKFKHRTDYDVTAKTSSTGSTTFVEKGWLKKNLKVLNNYKWKGIV